MKSLGFSLPWGYFAWFLFEKSDTFNFILICGKQIFKADVKNDILKQNNQKKGGKKFSCKRKKLFFCRLSLHYFIEAEST